MVTAERGKLKFSGSVVPCRVIRFPISAQSHRRRNLDAERLGGIEVECELKMGRPFDRQRRRFSPGEQFANIVGDTLILVG
jgi:hypothetical protein